MTCLLIEDYGSSGNMHTCSAGKEGLTKLNPNI